MLGEGGHLVGDIDSGKISAERNRDGKLPLVVAAPVHIAELLTSEGPVLVEEFASQRVAHQRLDGQTQGG